MRFLVVGAGAIGCLVGGRLAAADHDVTLVARDWLAHRIADSGLRLNIRGETIYVPNLAAVTTVAEAIFEFGPFDLALFTMKSYDTASGIQELQASLDRPLSVMSLQNGVGNEQLLSEAFGAHRVIAGIITAPAEMPVPGVIRAGSGGIGLAPLNPAKSVTSVVAALQSARFETRVYDDWRALKWSKLLLNLIGNATSAILDWPPEQIFSNARLFDLEWRAWQEALAVVAVQGLRVVSLPGYPLPWALRLLRWTPPSLLQSMLKRAIVRGRGGKMPSLHIDLEKGKPSSEVTVLNGAVVDVGRQLGIPTPVNAVLTETLTDIVRGKLEWDTFRGDPDRLVALVEAKQGQEERVNS
jgi:2-dehydropantoate 2-reductase